MAQDPRALLQKVSTLQTPAIAPIQPPLPRHCETGLNPSAAFRISNTPYLG